METLPIPADLSFDEMVALYDGLRLAYDVACALSCQPKFNDDRTKNPNKAGDVIDALCTLLGASADAVADMADAARPCPHSQSYHADVDSRAHIVSQQAFNTDGVIKTAKVLAKLYPAEGV